MLETSSTINSSAELSELLERNGTSINDHVRGVFYTPLIQAVNFSVDAVTQLFADESGDQDLGNYRITVKLPSGTDKVVYVDFPDEIEPKLNAYLDLAASNS